MKDLFFPYLNTQTNSNSSFSLLTVESLIEWACKNHFDYLSIADYFPYSIIDFFTFCNQKKIKPLWGVKFFCKSKKEEELKISVTAFPLSYEGYESILSTLFSANSPLERVFLLEEIFPTLSKYCFLVLELKRVEDIQKFSHWWSLLNFKEDVKNDNIFLGFDFFLLSPKENIPENIWPRLLPFFSFKFLESKEEKVLHYLKKTCFSKSYFLEDCQLVSYSFSISKEDFFAFCTNDENFFQFLLEQLKFFVSSIRLDLEIDKILKKKNIKINLSKQKEEFLKLKERCYNKLELLTFAFPKERKEKYFFALEKELKAIKKLEYCNYLLTFTDVVDFLKEKRSITGFGRGSAVSSLVVFLLGITKVDPIKHDLFFERFLNEERKTSADIDLDVEDQELVFEYLLKKYNNNKVTKVVRMLVRKKIGFGEASRELIKLFNLEKEIFDFSDKENSIWKQKKIWEFRYPKLLYLVKKIHSLYYGNAQLHASGVIISEKPLSEIPLASFQGYPVIFWEEERLNELSLKKYDFLSLKTTLNFLRFVRDDLFLELAVDCSDLDLRDKNTWELFSNHLLTGVFQLDTPSARNLLTKFCPNSFSELVLFLALNKPKTTSKVSRMIFLKENKSVPSISECFREIVVDTGYCVVFEEQVSQIISLVYKCSFSEAELKRKNFEYILLEKNAFINEIKKKNTQLSTYETNWIYENLSSSVIINKAHAVAYSLLAYYCAFLKANYFDRLIIFWLNSNVNDKVIIANYLEDAFFFGYETILPEINVSFLNWVSENQCLIMGFSSLKGYQETFFTNIISERRRAGVFSGLDNFLERTFIWWEKIEISVLEDWVELGLFRSFGLKQWKKISYGIFLFVRLKKFFPCLERTIAKPFFEKESGEFNLALVNKKEYSSLEIFVSFFSRWKKKSLEKKLNSSFELLFGKKRDQFLVYAIILEIEKITNVLYRLQLRDIRGKFNVFLSKSFIEEKKDYLIIYNEMFFFLKNKILNYEVIGIDF